MGNIIVIVTILFLLFSTVVISLIFYAILRSPHPTPLNNKQSPSGIRPDDNTQPHDSDDSDDSDDITISLNLHDIQSFIRAKAEIVYNGKVYSIDNDHYTIGHDEECNLTVVERSVSGRHCKIDYKDNTFTISDIDSKNGTYLNGQRVIKSTELHNGDEIRLGLVAMTFKRRSDDYNVVNIAAWSDL